MSKSENIKLVGQNKINILERITNDLKNALLNKTYKILPKDEAGLCAALLLGDKSKINNDIENSFREASLSHMLAISGAHISYILLGVSTVLSYLKIHKRWAKTFICMFFTIFYVFSRWITKSIVKSLYNGNFKFSS